MLSGTVEGARAPKRCVLLECQEIEKFAIALTMLDQVTRRSSREGGCCLLPFRVLGEAVRIFLC
jgi:hypothetical protein